MMLVLLLFLWIGAARVALPLEAWPHFDEALRRLCDLLEAAVRLSRPPERGDVEDYSYIWRTSIEDHGQNSGHTLKGGLVSAVRDAAERLRRTPESIPAIIDLLEKRGCRIFHRIGLRRRCTRTNMLTWAI
jgi:hypothetical protein